MNSDWFAAFSPDMLDPGATGATGATVILEGQKSGRSAIESRSDAGCNGRATGCNTPDVAPVAPEEGRGATDQELAKGPEKQGSEGSVALVAPVAPKAEGQTESDLRDRYEERAAFLEYHEGLSRPDAERRAACEVYRARIPNEGTVAHLVGTTALY